MNLLDYNVRKGKAKRNWSEGCAVLLCTGFTSVVLRRRRAAGFRNESESEEAASRFVRAVYTARLIEIVEVMLPVRAEETVRFGRQEKRYFLVR